MTSSTKSHFRMPHAHSFNPIIDNFVLYLFQVLEFNAEVYLSMFVYYEHSDMATYQLCAV